MFPVSLAERDASITSLQEELKEAREKPVEVRVSSHTSSSTIEATLLFITHWIVTPFWQDALKDLTALQTETKETLQTLFPHIPLETHQVRSSWFLGTICWLSPWWLCCCKMCGVFFSFLSLTGCRYSCIKHKRLSTSRTRSLSQA